MERRKSRSRAPSAPAEAWDTPWRHLAPELDLREGYDEELRAAFAAWEYHEIGHRPAGNLEHTSLGEYLASLRPVQDEKSVDAAARNSDEVTALLGSALLKVLGPKVGLAFLPVLGQLGKVHKIAVNLFNMALPQEDVSHKSMGALAAATPATFVQMIGGVSTLQIIAGYDVAALVMASRKNQAKRAAEASPHGSGDDAEALAPPPQLTAVEKFRFGETEGTNFPEDLIRNPFSISDHFQSTILAFEEILSSQGPYDPHVYPATGKPQPVEKNILPDLYLGYGGLRMTHTNRQILEQRLISILLNRLGANDLSTEDVNKDAKAFEVRLTADGAAIFRPCHFLAALRATGHEIKAYCEARTTSFGMGLCVREELRRRPPSVGGAGDDGAEAVVEHWVQVPLAVCMRTGLDDSRGRPARTLQTHGCLCLEISGPMVSAYLQWFQGVEGWTGWRSNHKVDAPFKTDAVLCCGGEGVGPREPFSEGGDTALSAVRAARVAGLLSCVLNSVATRLGLPMGGYGWLGVCNTSAAVVEMALTGRTDMYPIVSLGRFYGHVLRRAREMRARLAGDETAGAEAAQLVEAIVALPSDVHPTPATAPDTARRALHCIPPKTPFAADMAAREVLQAIIDEAAEEEELKRRPASAKTGK